MMLLLLQEVVVLALVQGLAVWRRTDSILQSNMMLPPMRVLVQEPQQALSNKNLALLQARLNRQAQL